MKILKKLKEARDFIKRFGYLYDNPGPTAKERRAKAGDEVRILAEHELELSQHQQLRERVAQMRKAQLAAGNHSYIKACEQSVDELLAEIEETLNA